MIINISIANKYATATGAPVIVCGNSDYSIQFTFDAEWDGLDPKTARFVFVQDGAVKYADVVFTGDTVAVPVLSNTKEVLVGVYAGNLQTSAPARIPCDLSIRCGTGAPADPTPSQYDQIMELLSQGITEADIAAAVASELAKRGQLKPEFANSIEECTDTSKLYVLPDGYIYGYAKTEIEGGLINIVDEVGYVNDTRISTSQDTIKSQTGYVATNDINISEYELPIVFRTQGVNFNDGSYSAYRAYRVDGTSFAGFLSNPSSNAVVTIEHDDDGNMVFTILSGSCSAIKFCGKGVGEDLIITIDGVMGEPTIIDGWVNTGHAFVPADYESQILTLENDVKTLKTKVKVLEDTALYGDSIPDYVLTEAEEVADKVLAVRNADSFVMALASDFHTNGEDISSVSVLHAGQGMNAINSMTQLDLVALLGDYEIYGFSYGDADTDGEDARKSFKHIKKAFSSIAKGVPFMQLQGNHDELPADTTEGAQQKYYAYIGANNVGTVTDYNNKFRNYGYRDFENYKIRVIYLNSADVSDSGVTGSCYVSTEQLNWLNTVALNLTDSEWGIIVLSHHPLNWTGMSGLLNVLDEYKGNGEGAELIAHFHGHLHNFRAETLGTNGVPTITIPNACFGRNNEYGTSSSYSDSIKTAYGDTDESGNQRVFEKTADTAEDTAFNIITVDRKNRKIYAHCYGAGVDREFNY